jgi:hypothetical protein
LLALATVLTGLLVAGCGGGSGSRAASKVAAASASPSAAPGAAAASEAGPPGALAFAKCMRSHGVPGFPDPQAGGGFAFRPGAGIVSSPAFKAAQATCGKLLPGGGLPTPGSTTHPSAQTLAKLLRISRCMRQHGITQFPDPTTTVPSLGTPSGPTEITDFDGAILVFPGTMNLQSPAYKQALAACGAPPLGLPH